MKKLIEDMIKIISSSIGVLTAFEILKSANPTDYLLIKKEDFTFIQKLTVDFDKRYYDFYHYGYGEYYTFTLGIFWELLAIKQFRTFKIQYQVYGVIDNYDY